jgi:hypothetical protein
MHPLALVLFATLAILIASPSYGQCRNGSCSVPVRRAKPAAKPQQSVQQRAAWYPGALLSRRGR